MESTGANAQLLLVEDDRELARMLAEYLQLQGYRVMTVGSGEEALARLATLPVALVVLDIGLPGIDGLETLQRLRASYTLPVIMLTARGEEQDRIAGLLAGADDYLPKPFNPLELSARIGAVLKRSSAASVGPLNDQPTIATPVVLGNLQLNLKRRELRVHRSPVHLTAAEWRILEILTQRRGEVITRADLTQLALDRPLELYDRSIDTLISKLRRKLADAGAVGAEIRGLRGHGYVLDIDP